MWHRGTRALARGTPLLTWSRHARAAPTASSSSGRAGGVAADAEGLREEAGREAAADPLPRPDAELEERLEAEGVEHEAVAALAAALAGDQVGGGRRLHAHGHEGGDARGQAVEHHRHPSS